MKLVNRKTRTVLKKSVRVEDAFTGNSSETSGDGDRQEKEAPDGRRDSHSARLDDGVTGLLRGWTDAALSLGCASWVIDSDPRELGRLAGCWTVFCGFCGARSTG